MKRLILSKPENPDFKGKFLPVYTQVVCFISLKKKDNLFGYPSSCFQYCFELCLFSLVCIVHPAKQAIFKIINKLGPVFFT